MPKATFAAGCFWGVEKLFSQQTGVISTRVGYTGGHTKNPTYQEVCSGNTGHAEAIEIEYDPKQITYIQLLNLFFNNHTPTILNRQGPDVGSQYRSVIFYHTHEQKSEAFAIKKELEQSHKFTSPIVTEIVEATEFYPAEEYHQQYLKKREGY